MTGTGEVSILKRWQYAHVVYDRNRKPSEPCLAFDHVSAMSDIGPERGLYLDMFLETAGERGWELTTVLLPFPRGKELSTGVPDEDDRSTFFVNDPLDIQWLIFKREV